MQPCVTCLRCIRLFWPPSLAAWVRGSYSWQACREFLTRNMWSISIFFISSCMAFYFILVLLAIRQEQPDIQEAHDNEWQKAQESFKYILLWSWTSNTYTPFYKSGEEPKSDLPINCLLTKCYVTTDRMFFGGDLTKFDAILFHGQIMNSSDLPKERSRHQQYIFFSLESAYYNPVCEEVFDGFFNWTWTYRLDSDIPYPFIQIHYNDGAIVGPKRNMQWKEMEVVFDELITLNKIGAAAWCMSDCNDKTGRREYVTALQNALKPYNLILDLFGKCDSLQNSIYLQLNCNDLPIYSYFFYMSMENSLDEDYVTKKLLTAIQNDAVPIVYGGADYTRFLPPHSYIDAREHNITGLAAKMNEIIRLPEEYIQYFWWKEYYSYHDPQDVENLCELCEALHNKEMLNTTKIYYHFRNWWNPDFRCEANS